MTGHYANVRYGNTLHGFQVANDNVIIAFLPEYTHLTHMTEYVQAQTGITSVYCDDWIGHNYIQCALKDRDHIPDIINATVRALTQTVENPPPVKPGWVYVCTFTVCINILQQKGYGPVHFNQDGQIFIEDQEEVDFFTRTLPGVIRLQTKLRPRYYPGMQFSLAMSEQQIISEWRENRPILGERMSFDEYIVPWMCFRTDRWASAEGQAFCTMLRQQGPQRCLEKDTEEPSEFLPSGWVSKLLPKAQRDIGNNLVIDFPLYTESQILGTKHDTARHRSDEPTTVSAAKKVKLETASPSLVVQPVVVETTPECMICWERVPDTVVLPCLHKVVCDLCSRALQQTADAKTCVQCRCVITQVLENCQ